MAAKTVINFGSAMQAVQEYYADLKADRDVADKECGDMADRMDAMIATLAERDERIIVLERELAKALMEANP